MSPAPYTPKPIEEIERLADGFEQLQGATDSADAVAPYEQLCELLARVEMECGNLPVIPRGEVTVKVCRPGIATQEMTLSGEERLVGSVMRVCGTDHGNHVAHVGGNGSAAADTVLNEGDTIVIFGRLKKR